MSSYCRASYCASCRVASLPESLTVHVSARAQIAAGIGGVIYLVKEKRGKDKDDATIKEEVLAGRQGNTRPLFGLTNIALFWCNVG